MNNRILKRLKTKYKQIDPVVRALLLLTIILIGFVFAKYLWNGEDLWGRIIAEKYYFTVDLIGDSKMVVDDEGQATENYAFTPQSNTQSWSLYGGNSHTLQIKIQNYYDDLRVTDSNIVYTVSVLSDTKVTKPSSITCSSNAGSLAGGSPHDAIITLTIPANETDGFSYEDGSKVQLKIKSTKPYVKELTLVFNLHISDTNLYFTVEDAQNSPFAKLIIMTGVRENGETASITPTVTWPSGLQIDYTNNLTFKTDGSGTITQQEITSDSFNQRYSMELSQALETGRSEAIFFFKTDISKDYSCEKTVVQKVNDRYVINIPALSPIQN